MLLSFTTELGHVCVAVFTDRGAGNRAVRELFHRDLPCFFSPHCFEILVFQTCLKKILIKDESSRSIFSFKMFCIKS